MPDTNLWSTFSCCLLLLHAVNVDAGQHQSIVPLTGNRTADAASKCNAAKQSWVEAAGRSFLSVSTYNSTTTVSATSTVYTTVTHLSSKDALASPYTLCDGFPRINGSRTLASTLVPYNSTYTRLASTSVFTTLPAPNCTINASDCARLNQAYSSSLSVYNGFTSASPNAVTAPPSPAATPICGPAKLTTVSVAVDDAKCAMNKASVQLLYWPVTADPSCDTCHRSNCPTTTPAPSISGKANTAVWHNVTLTSPTVYIAFEGSWSFSRDGTDYTKPAQLVIPQTADAVSSYCGKPGGGYSPPQKVNYANFNSPVPADVYRCQPSCYRDPLPYKGVEYTTTQTYTFDDVATTKTFTQTTYLSIAPTNLCSTIWDDYAPVLSIPAEFKTIKPSGYVDFHGAEKVCNFIFDEDAVLFDPPIALQEAQSVIKPTMPAHNPAQPTAADTFTALPVKTDGQDEPNPPSSPSTQNSSPTKNSSPPQNSPPKQNSPPTQNSPHTPGNQGPPQVQPTSQPGGGRIEQTATALNVGGYIATGIGLTVVNNNEGHGKGDVTISVAPGGQGLVINGATTTIDAHRPSASGSGSGSGSGEVGVVTIGGQSHTYTKQGSQVTIGGQTIVPGGTAVVGGQTVTLSPDGSHIEIGSGPGKTTTELTPSGSAVTGVVTIGGQTHTFTRQGSQVTIAGQTLAPGGTAVLGGQTVTLSPDSSHIEVGTGTGSGTTTLALSPTGSTSLAAGQTGYITATGTTLTYSVIDGNTVINGQTLKPDSAVTLTSARSSSVSTTSHSSARPSETSPGPSTTTATDAAVSLTDLLDWRCQLIVMLALSVLLAGL